MTSKIIHCLKESDIQELSEDERCFSLLTSPNYFTFIINYEQYFKIQDDEDNYNYRRVVCYLFPERFNLADTWNIITDNADIMSIKSKNKSELASKSEGKIKESMFVTLHSFVGYYGFHYFTYSKRSDGW